MRKKGENNVKPLRVKLRSARQNNDFTLDVESQLSHLADFATHRTDP